MYKDSIVNETIQSFAYEIKGNSAVIWRCFSRDTRVEIPSELGGYPVTAIAPYAFSAHMEKGQIDNGLKQGRLLMQKSLLQDDGEPELCGDRLEEIHFPKSVRHVGRYCFYNCANLRRIEFHGKLEDWGSGVFTGCHHVSEMQVYVDPDGRTYLKDVLDELPEAMQVEYMLESEDGSYLETRLVFPEFYEEGIENTPARILETRIHGSGVRYRNCFKNRQFDFQLFDEQFYYAQFLESEDIVSSLAMNRLRYPYALTEKGRVQYETYIRDHSTRVGTIILKKQDMDALKWLISLYSDSDAEEKKALLDILLEQASELRFTEATGYLMDIGRRSSVKKRKRLVL